jgi:hypothetical protein
VPDSTTPPPNLKSYFCVHVLDGSRPILYVARPDGDWCVLCGDDDPADASQYRVVGLGHAAELDPAIEQLLDLGPDEEATRDSVDAHWVRGTV